MSFKKFVLSLVTLALLLAGVTFYLKLVNDRQESPTPSLKPAPLVVPKVTPPVPEKVTPEPVKKHLPKLAIVIDDIGNSKELGEEVLALKGVTIAIIPELKYSLYFANKGKELGKDILVHMPMEPKNKDKYSDDTKILKTDMAEEEIKKLTEYFLKAVPYAKGVNNHMGSKFTEDTEKLEPFFKVLKSKNLFFLDSRTSSDSKAYEVGHRLGIIAYKRDVFLDHEISEDKISEQLDRAIKEAYNNGYAVAIGHPHPETIHVLKRRYKELSKTVEIVPLSSLQ